jgi:hypothetical protein
MVGEPQAVTGELHPQDGLSTTAIVLFPLLFWPFFWAIVVFGWGYQRGLILGDRLPQGNAAISEIHGLLTIWTMIVVPYLFVSPVCAAWVAWRAKRGKSISYVITALIGAAGASPWVIGWTIAGQSKLMVPVLLVGIVSALIGRFAMARLGILPSRWPKAGKS